MLSDIRPEPPQWALDAGLPGPFEGESFAAYCTRLGLEPGEFLIDLTDRTSCFANLRLAGRLARDMPEQWSEYVHKRSALTPARREALDRIARQLWPRRAV